MQQTRAALRSPTFFAQLFARFFLGLALLAAGGLSTGCNPNSIGRLCVNPQMSAPTGPQIVSPALECPSRLCLIEPTTSTTEAQGGSRNTCTAECGSDGDCDAETKDYCQSGFVCAIATQVGSFCCKKFCICKDDLQDGVNKMGEGDALQVITPYACDPVANQNVSCKNVSK